MISVRVQRRRSMFPKHFIPVSPGPDFDAPVHMSSEADEEDEGRGGIDGSPCASMVHSNPPQCDFESDCAMSPIAQDPDLSIRSKEEDDLPPLERARKRRSILPGGQTRLFP